MSAYNGPLVGLFAAGRAANARLCVDTVVVTRVTPGALNRVTHQHASSSVTIYAGQARIKRSTPTDRTLDDRAVEASRTSLELPWGVTGADQLVVGDQVTVTSTDSVLTGRTMSVVAPEWGTTSMVHRYRIEDVDR